MKHKKLLSACLTVGMLALVLFSVTATVSAHLTTGPATEGDGSGPSTTTPIKHLVVIFQENVSFDHYFGTYPHAANPPGVPAFYPAPGTPSVKSRLARRIRRMGISTKVVIERHVL